MKKLCVYILLLTMFFSTYEISTENMKTHASTSIVQVKEAESGILNNGSVVVSRVNASNNLAVGNMHVDTAYNEIANIDGGLNGGEHTLTIRFATGDVLATKSLYVNNVKVSDLTFSNTGSFDTFVNKTVKVNLQPGMNNSIRIQNDGGSTFTYGVEIDKYTIEPAQFTVMGYIHPVSFARNDIDSDAFNYITDVNLIGFHKVDSNGNIFTRTDEDYLPNWEQYIEELHDIVGDRPVKKWMTLNGDAEVMAQVVGNPTARANYIAQINDFLQTYDFDGVDIDWEYPYGATQWNNFSTTIVEMQQLVGKHGKDISLALSHWGVDLTTNAFASVEHINYMSYDNGYYHATFENSYNGIQYFLNLGVPRDKINLGLAWYGRPFDGSAYWADYDEIVDQFDIQPEQDIVFNMNFIDSNNNVATKDIYFNGIDLNRRKMLLAEDMNLGGVMIWHLFSDVAVNQSNSLLKAIIDERDQYEAYRSLPNLATNQWYYANQSDSGYSVYQMFDINDNTTYWQAPSGVTNNVYVQLDFKQPTEFNTIVLKEHGNSVRSFKIQHWYGGQWVDLYDGEFMGAYKVATFNTITSSNIRVLIESAELPNIPSNHSTFTQYNKLGIYELEVYNR